MNDKQHKEGFQIERLAFFSDAIFAIAITLLIIEVKVPEIPHNEVTNETLIKGLAELLPKFIGFLVSFIVIGMYWFSHHRLFYYIDHFNPKLLWANLLFMMPIAVMPFSSAFLSEYYVGSLSIPMIVYTITIALTGFFSYRLWSIVGNKKYHISSSLSKPMANYNKTRALTIPIIFIVLIFVSMISNWLSYVVLPIAPPLATFIIKKYYRKKHPELGIH